MTDLTSLRNITNLIPDLIFLYQSFMDDEYDDQEIVTLRESLSEAYQYEMLKGKTNSKLTDRIHDLRTMFEEHVNDRLQNGRWIPAHYSDQFEKVNKLIGETIIAIRGDL